jgi:hypothetical protein
MVGRSGASHSGCEKSDSARTMSLRLAWEARLSPQATTTVSHRPAATAAAACRTSTVPVAPPEFTVVQYDGRSPRYSATTSANMGERSSRE